MDEKRLAELDALLADPEAVGAGVAPALVRELVAEVRRLRAELEHSAVPRCAHCGVGRGLAHHRECPTPSVLFDPHD